MIPRSGSRATGTGRCVASRPAGESAMQPGRPSATAGVIAASTAFLALDSRLGHLVPGEAAEASAWFLNAASPRADRWLRLMHRPAFRRLLRVVERLMLPGIVLHYALRKRCLEEN